MVGGFVVSQVSIRRPRLCHGDGSLDYFDYAALIKVRR